MEEGYSKALELLPRGHVKRTDIQGGLSTVPLDCFNLFAVDLEDTITTLLKTL